jgi:hypothetical protein
MLGLSTSSRSIAATADFAGDDGRRQCLLGAPVGCIEGRIDQEAEEGRQFDRRMTREALHVLDRARIIKQVQHLVEEMPARDISLRRGIVGYLVACKQKKSHPAAYFHKDGAITHHFALHGFDAYVGRYCATIAASDSPPLEDRLQRDVGAHSGVE